MKDPKTIKEAIEQIQEAMSLAIPGMQVTVSINLTSAAVDNVTPHEEATKQEIESPAVPQAKDEAAPDVDLKGLRALLNAYAKTAGKDKALALVSKFSKTGNPKDIPTDSYKDVIKAIGGYTLEPKSGDA